MEEINKFFMDGIPAREWKHQPRLHPDDDTYKGRGNEELDNNDSDRAEKKSRLEVEVSKECV